MLELRTESDTYDVVWPLVVTCIKKIVLSTVVATSLFLGTLVD